MNTEVMINVDHQALQVPENIECLLDAANDILSSSEADFEDLKNKKWYKRIWEIVTFSKDNEKQLAKSVGNLAKLQDIIIKMLLMLSKENVRFAQWVAENTSSIEKLSENDNRLAKVVIQLKQELQRIKYGYYQRLNISTIENEHKNIIISATRRFVLSCDVSNVYVQEYLGNLRAFCARLDVEGANFDYYKIELLTAQEQELLYIILCEVSSLMDNPNMKAFQEVIENIAISQSKSKKIHESINETIYLEGKEFIAKIYYFNADDSLKYITVENMEFDSKIPLNDDVLSLNLDDTTKTEYKEVRDIVLGYINEVCTDESKDARIKSREKRMQNFISSNSPRIVADAAIAIADTSLLGDGKEGILITTSGIYYKSFLEHVEYFSYQNIDISKCELQYPPQKGSPTLVLYFFDGQEAYSFNVSNINSVALLDMLTKVCKLPNIASMDQVIYFSDMQYAVKLPYIKIIINLFKSANLSFAEIIRFAKDLRFDSNQISDLIKYINSQQTSNIQLLVDINKSAPFPSKMSVRYSLIEDMARLLHITKNSTSITAVERSFIIDIAKSFNIETSNIEELIKFAQIPWRIINNNVSEKEMSELSKGFLTTLLGGGIPLTTALGSSVLYWNVWWFDFIPGIGTLLATTIGGVTIANKIITDMTNKVEYNNQQRKMLMDCIDSYSSAIQMLEKVNNENISISEYKTELIKTRNFLSKLLGNNVELSSEELDESNTKLLLDTLKSFLSIAPDYIKVYFAPEIAPDVLSKCIEKLTFNERESQIVAIVDPTFTQTLAFGVVFTKEGFYIKKYINSPKEYVKYSDIRQLHVKEKFVFHVLEILTKDFRTIEWSDARLIDANDMKFMFDNIKFIYKINNMQ